MTFVRAHRLSLALVLLAATFVSPACSRTVRYALLGTRAYPTTEGEARIEARDGGGYDVTLDVDNMPSVERLGAGLTTYVVWVTEAGADRPTRAGVLEVDPVTRKGHAVVASRTASMQVRVSAEPDADVTEPSEFVVVDALLQAAD